jgi:hypothetical protein
MLGAIGHIRRGGVVIEPLGPTVPCDGQNCRHPSHDNQGDDCDRCARLERELAEERAIPRLWLVWEEEYPEGSTPYEAASAEEAKAQYERDTGESGTPLCVEVLTLKTLIAREKNDEREARLAALEEAAQVAESWAGPEWLIPWDQAQVLKPRDFVAAAIRTIARVALSSPAKDGDQ